MTCFYEMCHFNVGGGLNHLYEFDAFPMEGCFMSVFVLINQIWEMKVRDNIHPFRK